MQGAGCWRLEKEGREDVELDLFDPGPAAAFARIAHQPRLFALLLATFNHEARVNPRKNV